ncbi:MAG TPA: 4'-phosphopantetheinyl transferase superfamily protein [Propionicimonas sp.]|nr:4'-phosphopantetheinyl transferase superfamily protein [Propionicimonas sp.]HRA05354.1 4'-phosphopantetheinyl transferase superfamily protein [Propionicimonas sp.]
MIRAAICTDPSLRLHPVQSVVARRMLRRTLARCGAPDADVRLVANSFGRPALAGRECLQVSIAHCEGAVLVAAADARIGVDVERVRPHDHWAEARMLQPPESAEVADAADPDREFFCYWTVKESYVKALGVGLSYPVKRLRVTFDPDERAPRLNRPNTALWLDEACAGLVLAFCCLHADPAESVVTERVRLSELEDRP